LFRPDGMHCPSTFVIPRGHMQAPAPFGIMGGRQTTGLTHFLPVRTVPSGQAQAVSAAFGTSGGRQTTGRTHLLPVRTVPAGQTHSPRTGLGTIGAGQALWTMTHSLPSICMPCGQTQELGVGPEIIGGVHAPESWLRSSRRIEIAHFLVVRGVSYLADCHLLRQVRGRLPRA